MIFKINKSTLKNIYQNVLHFNPCSGWCKIFSQAAKILANRYLVLNQIQTITKGNQRLLEAPIECPPTKHRFDQFDQSRRKMRFIKFLEANTVEA